ncbi:MAG: hypothetical protein K2X11_17575, partial [Acetobacteraceae bacterium]|nr:hypothetical protein [Acetobacteraceae bacterium]
MRDILVISGLGLLAFVAPAAAQQRVVVIPAGVEVAVPSRDGMAAMAERVPVRRHSAPRRAGEGRRPET